MAVAPRPARIDVNSASRTPRLLERPLEPPQAEARERPRLVGAVVEGVDADDDERQVDEAEDRDRGDAQQEPRAPRDSVIVRAPRTRRAGAPRAGR